MSNLTPVIKSIQDVMRQDAGMDGDAQRIEQMVWLLFPEGLRRAGRRAGADPRRLQEPDPQPPALAELGR